MKAVIGRLHTHHVVLTRLDAPGRTRWIVVSLWITVVLALAAFWGFILYLALQVVAS